MKTFGQRGAIALLALLLNIGLTFFGPSQPVQAALLCRTLAQQQVCILTIQRSAKNHWEYRVVASIDGVKQPLEIYNCRDRDRIRQDGKRLPFQPNGLGPLVCQILQR